MTSGIGLVLVTLCPSRGLAWAHAPGLGLTTRPILLTEKVWPIFYSDLCVRGTLLTPCVRTLSARCTTGRFFSHFLVRMGWNAQGLLS